MMTKGHYIVFRQITKKVLKLLCLLVISSNPCKERENDGSGSDEEGKKET